MTKYIAVVSGKGGVGKTTCTINVGYALQQRGKRVLLVDGNLETPHLGLHLGLMQPDKTLNHFLQNKADLRDTIHNHESGLKIIPASPLYSEIKTKFNVIEFFEHSEGMADIILIDCPAGMGKNKRQIIEHADEVLVVVNPTLSSVMEGLKSIQLAGELDSPVAGIILNKTHRGWHELKSAEVEEILGFPLLANIRKDRKIRKSQHQAVPLGHLYRRANSTQRFDDIAKHLSLE